MLNLIFNSKLDSILSNQIIIGSVVVFNLFTGSYYLGKRIYNYYKLDDSKLNDSLLNIDNKDDDNLVLFRDMITDAYNDQNNTSDNSSTIKNDDNTPKQSIIDLYFDDKIDKEINAVVETKDVSINPMVETIDRGVQTSDDLMLDLHKEWLYGTYTPSPTWSDSEILNFVKDHPSYTSPIERFRNAIPENASPGGSNYNLDSVNEELTILKQVKNNLLNKFSSASSKNVTVMDNDNLININTTKASVTNIEQTSSSLSPLPVKLDLPLHVNIEKNSPLPVKLDLPLPVRI
jgi:hypothetical protein